MNSPIDSKRLNVLIIAEAANPEWTSVPLLGWSHTLALSKVCNTHLATQIRNTEAIEKFGWKKGEEFTAINSERLAAPFHKIALFLRGGDNLGWTISTALNSLIYPYFEYLCWRQFKTALEAGQFDIVHRITPVSPTAPSYLAKKLSKLGVPFVVGPLNGGVPWPVEFRNLQHKEKEWLSHIRGVYKLMPGYGSLRKYASALIAGSMATKEQIPQKYAAKTLYVPENAIDRNRFSLKNQSLYHFPIKAVFVGRLVPYKGADMAIEAMTYLLRQGKIEFDIYGSGPEEAELRALVVRLGVEDSVTIHGFVPNKELQQHFVQGDLLVFPSVREFGGGVVLEAMALGVVPLVVDYAGPTELVTPESGYTIGLGNREELIVRMQSVLEDICANPAQLIPKRDAAIARIHAFYTWEKKAEQDLEIYDWLVNKQTKPDFHLPFP